jgi:hypothetical protein
VIPGLPLGPQPCKSLYFGREPKARVVIIIIYMLELKVATFIGSMLCIWRIKEVRLLKNALRLCSNVFV